MAEKAIHLKRYSFRSALSNNGRESDATTAFSAIGPEQGKAARDRDGPDGAVISLSYRHLECCLPPSFKEKGALGTICVCPAFRPLYWKVLNRPSRPQAS
jgi:hypothetical protein